MAGLIVKDSNNSSNSEPKIYLGTSAFTAAGWQGAFYPPEIKSKDYLSYYAQHFDTVEVNSTLYGCPSPRTVENWAAKTPDSFIFSIKTPRSIMPRPEELAQKFDPIIADWTYIRWLGDRKGIELQTLTWDKIIVDRTAQLTSWVDFCYQIKRRGITVYGYANNHYAGHGPATIRQFRDLWRKKGFPPLPEPAPTPKPLTPIPAPPKKQPSLFD